MIVALFSISVVSCGAVLTVNAQSDLQTIKHRDMVIDLGNGVKVQI